MARKKPKMVSKFTWTGENLDDAKDFLGDCFLKLVDDMLEITSVEGVVWIGPKEEIGMDAKDQFWPMQFAPVVETPAEATEAPVVEDGTDAEAEDAIAAPEVMPECIGTRDSVPFLLYIDGKRIEIGADGFFNRDLLQLARDRIASETQEGNAMWAAKSCLQALDQAIHFCPKDCPVDIRHASSSVVFDVPESDDLDVAMSSLDTAIAALKRVKEAK
mgnify:CR=1 FL=1|jgi:hypothetical protein